MYIDDDVTLDIFIGMVQTAPNGEYRLWRAALSRCLLEDYLAKPVLFLDMEVLHYLADMADIDRAIVVRGAQRLMRMSKKEFWAMVKEYKGGSHGRYET